MPLESFSTNELTPAVAKEVEAFIDSQDCGHPFQFPEWSDSGATVTLLREQGRILWLATYSIYAPLGWKIPWIRAAEVNRGPVCDDAELWAKTTEEFAETMKQHGVTYVEVVPERVRQLDAPSLFSDNSGWASCTPQRASLRLNLSSSEDEIFANFKKTARYEVRYAERLGAEVCASANVAEVEDFLRIHESLAVRKGFSADPPERLRRQIEWLMTNKSRGALLVARVNKEVCGGIMIARAGRRCWYVRGATNREQPVDVGRILQWRALQWAKSRGCLEYDFGGYAPGAKSGPGWFKAGFGGTTVYFETSSRRVLRPGTYRAFRLLSEIF